MKIVVAFTVMEILVVSTAILWLWMGANYLARIINRREFSPRCLIITVMLAAILSVATGIFFPAVE